MSWEIEKYDTLMYVFLSNYKIDTNFFEEPRSVRLIKELL